MATKKKPTRKPAKVPAKVEVGRPTKFQPAYVEQARRLALLGMTDKEMADFFGVTERTLHRWKLDHPEFCHSLRSGKEGADVDVAASLYRAAIGGGTVTELKEETDSEGNIIKKKTVKELPANVTAMIYWLKNRQPGRWRDKVEIEDSTPPETVAANANRYVKVMALARERQRAILLERGILSDDEGAR